MCISQFLLAKRDRRPNVNEAATRSGAVSRIHFSVLGQGTCFISGLVTPAFYTYKVITLTPKEQEGVGQNQTPWI